jgi:hypothetical protein
MEFPMKTAANEYRAKAFECLSLAECMNDPEKRAPTACRASDHHR